MQHLLKGFIGSMLFMGLFGLILAILGALLVFKRSFREKLHWLYQGYN